MAETSGDRVQEIFAEAVQRPVDERADFVRQACGDDTALHARVSALLGALQEAGEARFMGGTTGAPETVVPPVTEDTSTVIDKYKLLQLIGEGGFGVVYMAQQEEPLRRRVALKIIKLGMDTKQVIARFEAERQALAMMDHPNIAKVFDAGATETGRPYFVMELVRGDPITSYCDRHNLSVQDRLALFKRVCLAVQHAHQKGIIHRDIKPSNVLVTLHDGQPVPKVIDFGIAKATNARLTEKTVFTEFRQFIGTPEYMSPEQAELTGLDIDTRSDVYSLGVLLYELLTGATPFDEASLRDAGYAEIQRIIREHTPPKPSTRLGTLERLPAVAAHRQTEPKALGVLIRGDLDWIVMKALEKDRTRRYETASEFAADIQRFLSDEPVMASPPSAGYRLRKLVRRNKATFATGATVVAALVVATIGTTYGLLRALQAEAVARIDRDEATRQADIARAVNDFLNDDLLAAVAPSVEAGRGRDVLMREVLDEAAERIDAASGPGGRFADKPLVEAAIRETIAATYRQLGLIQEAQRQAERALQLRRVSLGAQDPETLETLVEVATIYRLAGRYDDANRACDEALAIMPVRIGADDPRTMRAENLRANIAIDRGRWADAAAMLADVLERQRSVLGADHPDTLRSQSTLASVHMRQSRFDEAEALYRRTLEQQRRALGEGHPDTLITMHNLGAALLSQERFVEAEQQLARTLALQERILGNEHPRTLTTRRDLASAWMRLRRFDEAEAALEDLLEVRRRVSGPDHPETLMLSAVIGLVRRDRQAGWQAQIDLAAVIDAQRRTLGAEHPTTLITMAELARAYLESDRLDVAVPLAEEVVATARRVLGPRHKWTLKALWTLGMAYRKLGRFDDAEPVLVEVLESRRAVFGPDDPATIHGMANLALLRRSQGRLDEAERLGREAVEAFRRVLPEGDPRAVTHLVWLAGVVRDQGRYDEAEALYDEAVGELRRLLGADHADTLAAMSAQADLAWRRGDPPRAEAIWTDVLERRQRVLGPLHPASMATVQNLVEVWLAEGETAKAVGLLEEVRQFDPQNVAESNELAWMLLSAKPERMQDPQRALRLSRRVNEQTGYKNPHYLDTLAAALHRAGVTKEAVAMQRKAIEYAPIQSRADYELRLADYLAASSRSGG